MHRKESCSLPVLTGTERLHAELGCIRAQNQAQDKRQGPLSDLAQNRAGTAHHSHCHPKLVPVAGKGCIPEAKGQSGWWVGVSVLAKD